MKIISKLLLLNCLFLSFSTFAQTELTTEIEAVTIHLKGAEIIRTKRVDLPSGRTEYAFTGLSPRLNAKSVQVTADNGVEILSITSRINFMKDIENLNPRLLELRDSLDEIGYEMAFIKNEVSAYEMELKVLNSNLDLGMRAEGSTVAKIREATEFFRTKSKSIKDAITTLNREWTIKNKSKARLQQAVNELNQGNQEATSEINVILNTKTVKSSNLRLRYVVDDAGWSPIYDLVSTKINEPIKLKYRALAFNGSGVDWENVKVTLSTADPMRDASQPILSPWNLTQYTPALNKAFNGARAESDQAAYIDGIRVQSQVQNYMNSQNVITPQRSTKDKKKIIQEIQYQTIELSELTTEFEIDEPYTIPSERKPYSIFIEEFELNSNYKHYAVPKMEENVYLLAQITGWEDYDLIQGPMNVYQNEKYVGLANLNPNVLNDTLNLSLGIDQKVAIDRVREKDFNRNQFLGSNRITSFGYKISVKNNHNFPIEMELVDQVPKSNVKEIAVDLKEQGGALHTENTGQLKWRYTVKPSEKAVTNFEFTVKHPKSYDVKVSKTRNMVTPRYF